MQDNCFDICLGVLKFPKTICKQSARRSTRLCQDSRKCPKTICKPSARPSREFPKITKRILQDILQDIGLGILKFPKTIWKQSARPSARLCGDSAEFPENRQKHSARQMALQMDLQTEGTCRLSLQISEIKSAETFECLHFWLFDVDCFCFIFQLLCLFFYSFIRRILEFNIQSNNIQMFSNIFHPDFHYITYNEPHN